ncbi:hypothetical protein N7467_004211 [Penicillium canescens]|nr:hypothetical protein N7467_004211 [Penicillium canescens]
MEIIIWAIATLIRWVRLKIYQYEVTFAIYMLTPIEKLIFNTLLLTLITMITAGIYIYLPDHLRAIYGRLYYYWAGERLFSSSRLSVSSIFGETATQMGEMVYETAKNAAAATTARMAEL